MRFKVDANACAPYRIYAARNLIHTGVCDEPASNVVAIVVVTKLMQTQLFCDVCAAAAVPTNNIENNKEIPCAARTHVSSPLRATPLCNIHLYIHAYMVLYI